MATGSLHLVFGGLSRLPFADGVWDADQTVGYDCANA